MKIQLRHRHYGVHELIKEIEISGEFNDYCEQINRQDYKIDEQKIIDNLPEDFLPVSPDNILVTIGDEKGSIGQIHLRLFKYWVKYFDSYVLDIWKD